MTQAEIDKIQASAKVEFDGSECVATWGDHVGHGDTPAKAIEELIIGLEWSEVE